jgi:hypothetical protein
LPVSSIPSGQRIGRDRRERQARAGAADRSGEEFASIHRLHRLLPCSAIALFRLALAARNAGPPAKVRLACQDTARDSLAPPAADRL